MLESVLEMPCILCRKVEGIFICTPGTRIPFRETADFIEEKKKNPHTLTLEMERRMSKVHLTTGKKNHHDFNFPVENTEIILLWFGENE